LRVSHKDKIAAVGSSLKGLSRDSKDKDVQRTYVIRGTSVPRMLLPITNIVVCSLLCKEREKGAGRKALEERFALTGNQEAKHSDLYYE
jgi:hypothetical protein